MTEKTFKREVAVLGGSSYIIIERGISGKIYYMSDGYLEKDLAIKRAEKLIKNKDNIRPYYNEDVVIEVVEVKVSLNSILG